MTALRRLNDEGIGAFREHLRSIRAGSEFQENPALLYVDGYSTPIVPRIEITPKTFRNKYDAAAWLTTLLRPLDSPALGDDAGLWSWLALYYFDQLSPVGSDGKRRPREDYHYIPAPGGKRGVSRGHDRHLLAGPCRLYSTHGERSRVLLHPAVHQHGRFIYDLGYRRDFLMNRGLVEAVDLLYWNPKTKRPKRGAGGEGPGALRRLIAVLQQLELNYDLFGMTAVEILGLLPAEFEAWRPNDLFAAVAARA